MAANNGVCTITGGDKFLNVKVDRKKNCSGRGYFAPVVNPESPVGVFEDALLLQRTLRQTFRILAHGDAQ